MYISGTLAILLWWHTTSLTPLFGDRNIQPYQGISDVKYSPLKMGYFRCSKEKTKGKNSFMLDHINGLVDFLTSMIKKMKCNLICFKKFKQCFVMKKLGKVHKLTSEFTFVFHGYGTMNTIGYCVSRNTSNCQRLYLIISHIFCLKSFRLKL